MLSDLLRHFLTLYVPTTPAQADTALTNSDEIHTVADSNQENVGTSLQPLEVRMHELERHIEQLPRNTEDRQKLVECGYSHRLWEEVSPVE